MSTSIFRKPLIAKDEPLGTKGDPCCGCELGPYSPTEQCPSCAKFREACAVHSAHAVSTHAIELMKHTIGFRQDRVRRKKYVAFRNYFAAPSVIPEWESLVEQGLASKGSEGTKYIYYHVTRAGMNFLEQTCGVKIVESE